MIIRMVDLRESWRDTSGGTRMWIVHLLQDTLAAFLGGLALTAALFWLAEKAYPVSRISGRWYFQTLTEDTARDTFRGMYLKYEAIVWQEGAAIRGTTEKIYEASSTGRRQYEGTNRMRGELSGYSDRFVFSPNRVRLQLTEKGQERTSTAFFDLLCERGSLCKRLLSSSKDGRVVDGQNTNVMRGIFQSMAGSSSGKSVWSRNRYDPIFSEDVRMELSDTYGAIVPISAEGGLQNPS
jgi:hypothetical protein